MQVPTPGDLVRADRALQPRAHDGSCGQGARAPCATAPRAEMREGEQWIARRWINTGYNSGF